MPRKKMHAEFIEELKIANPSIGVLEQYINNSTKIRVKSNSCLNEWLARPSDLLRGHGCMNCVAKERVKHRTKSFEDFCSEIKVVNPEIVVIGEYINTHTKIAYRCLKCGYEGSARPNSLLRGHGCPECYKNNPRLNRTKTTEQFINEMALIDASIIVLGNYTKNFEPIQVQCNRCQYIWNARPNALLKGTGCPKCHRNTQTSFIEQFIYYSFVDVLGEEKVLNRDTTAIGKELDVYIPMLDLAFEPGAWFWHKEKIKEDRIKQEECRKHGIRLITIYDSYDEENVIDEQDIYCFDVDLGIIRYHHLLMEFIISIMTEYQLECSYINWLGVIEKARNASKRRTTKEFIDELSKVNSNIILLSEYHSSKSTISCECKVCGYKWEPVAGSLLNGQGCPACGRKQVAEKRKLSQEEFEKRVKSINSQMQMIDKYEKNNKKIRVKCNQCNYEWLASPSHLMTDAKCPKCSNNIRRTTQYFIDEMKVINPTMEVLGEYVGRRNKILVHCTICDYKWYPTPNNLLNGSGCPKCKKDRNSFMIICVETNEVYGSIKQASRDTGISSGSISNVLKGRTITAGGFHWKRVNKLKK